MADVTQKPSRRRRRPEHEEEPERSEESAQEEQALETPALAPQPEEVEGRVAEAREGVMKQPTLTSELKATVREAAIEVLRPVARKATTSAAKYAVTKGPELVKDRVAPKVSDAGGAGALAKGALSKGGGIAGGLTRKLGRKGRGEAPSAIGRGRRLPVQEHVDVAVDLETAYDQWTQFEEFPRFMHRVEKVEQRDDTTLMWQENIWGVRRSWEAEITDQRPCERIAWRSREGTQTAGVVTFHRLSDRLTRVQVSLDFQPQGMLEKAASGMRISRRALKSDLMRFKAYIEMRDEATGAWRGRIEEGAVVEEPRRKQREEPEEPEGEAVEEEGYEEEQEEPEAAAEDLEEEELEEEELEEEEPEEEEPEEEEPEVKPARRRRATRPTARRR